MITEFEEDEIQYNKILLSERKSRVQHIIDYYNESNFYVSFSGGKDSCVLSKLIDLALPDNNIPRVYIDTGIELNMMKDFVLSLKEYDWRIEVVKPTKNIKSVLEEYGYPFKSKVHAHCVDLYQNYGFEKQMVNGYLGKRPEFWHTSTCPKKLLYQFTEENNLKISDMCCVKLKEEPLINWAWENEKSIAIIGIMPDEGGRRANSNCLMFQGGKLKKFQPLVKVNKRWEDWFIKEYNIELCDLYKEPYNFPRTGCKGCPFALNLENELDVLEKYFPNERKQCEYIWKPVYDEYRRIGYRLKE